MNVDYIVSLSSFSLTFGSRYFVLILVRAWLYSDALLHLHPTPSAEGVLKMNLDSS